MSHKKNRDFMYEEACDSATSVNVRCDWVGEFGFLVIVTVTNKYMSLTNKVYVNLIKPPEYNSLINQGTSAYQREKKLA